MSFGSRYYLLYYFFDYYNKEEQFLMDKMPLINSSIDFSTASPFKLEYTEEDTVKLPDRVKLYYSLHKFPGDKTWLGRAFESSEKLRYILFGALRTLAPKGKEIAILVVDIVSPMVIPNISLYLSEHNNWHVGKPGETLSMEQLRELNPDGVSYYQDEDFFLALRHSEVGQESNVEQYILYVHKKAHTPRG